MSDRSEARGALHHETYRPAQFALDADAVAGDCRSAANQEGRQDFQQLDFIDRAAIQFVVYLEWAEIGVEVANVLIYAGDANTAAM
jgi:hypothetical protein